MSGRLRVSWHQPVHSTFSFPFCVTQQDEVFPALPQAVPLVGQTSLTHILLIKDQEKMIGQHLEVTSKIQLNWPNEGLQALWNKGRAPTGRAPYTWAALPLQTRSTNHWHRCP